MERKNFYSKVLLFGEYGIISNSNALSVPFKEFYGFLNKSTKLNQDQKHWAWTIWNVTIPVSKNDSFICRATDVNGNTQPSDISNKWNLRGLNNNTCHKKIYHDRNN